MMADKALAPDLTVNQVAQLLHVHRNTVVNLAKCGRLPAYRLGPRSQYRFRREIVVRFREARRVAQGSTS